MSLSDNILSPLQIEDARDAAYRASEVQRDVEDRLRQTSRDLAEGERQYRKALSIRLVELRLQGIAVTACADIARGEKKIADLRYQRDVAEGVHEAAKQQAFRRGADRRDVSQLLVWSMRRDLRTDAEPENYPRPVGAAG